MEEKKVPEEVSVEDSVVSVEEEYDVNTEEGDAALIIACYVKT